MLERIVQQVQLWAKFLFGKNAGLVAVFSQDDWNVETAGNQQRLVAEVTRRSARIDQQNAARLAAVASREDVEADASGFQQLAEENYERSFAGASDGKIPDADHLAFEAPGGEHLTVVEGISDAGGQTVDLGKEIQGNGLLGVRSQASGPASQELRGFVT